MSCVQLVILILLLLPAIVIGQDQGSTEKVPPENLIFSLSKREKIKLTSVEQAYIKAHPVIKASNEMDYPPFDFAIGGEPRGYTIDLLDLLAKRIGIKIEYINGYTWHELVQLFKDRKLDLLHTLAETPERKKFALFSDRFFRDRQVYITRKENPDISDISQLYGKTVSQAKGWNTTEYFQTNYPQVPLLIVNNLEEMLDAVAYGEAYATVVDEAAAAYTIKKNGLSDLKMTGWGKAFDRMKGQNFHFAAQKDSPELISMLNKALASLTIEDLDPLKRKWFGEEPAAINLTREEQTFIKAQPVITATNEQKWAPFNFFEEGLPKGFSIDYLNLLAEKAGLTVNYISGPSWKEFVEMAKKKEVDVLLNVAYNSKRTAWLEYLKQPYFSVHYGLVVNIDRKSIREFKDIFDKAIAVEDGFWMQNWFKENHPDVKLVPYKNTLDALMAVSLNEADVYVGNISVGGYLLNKHWLTNLKVLPLGPTKLKKSNELYIGVPKGMTVLKSILDKAMAAVTDEELNKFTAKWSLQGQGESFQQVYVAGIPLETKEQLYLKDLKEINYCVDPDWMPFERINEKGHHEGMAGDLMRDLEERTGITFRLVPTTTWSESLEFVQNGSCRILAAAAETVPRREYLDFSKPHGEYPLVVAVPNKELFVENLAAIRDKTIGVVQGYAHIDLIREKYPNFKIIEVKNVIDGLNRVRNDEIFGFVDTAPTIGYQIRRHGIEDLKIGGKLDIPLKLSIAIRKGESTELLSIINKALNSFSREEKQLLADKWFSIKIEKVFDYKRLWQILAVVIVVFMIFLFWNMKLARLNRSLKNAQKAADAANRAKSVFLANMSHELRTPLNAILGFSQLMRRDPNLSPEQLVNTDTINRSGEHLLSLINDVLDFSKIEAGRSAVNPEDFDLHHLLLGLEEMFRLHAEQKGLSLNFVWKTDVPQYIRTDPNKLRQVLINLLDNAVKHTETGGITLVVTNRQPGKENKQPGECFLHFEVVDTGVGISQEEQDQIFDAFFQTNGQSKPQQGTGLGLPISKKFVNLMGGVLVVDSQSGKGTRFTFDIPVELVDGAVTESSQLTPRVIGLEEGQPVFRLLVAEDNEVNRNLLVKLLQSVAFDVQEAANGQEAIELWRNWRPHLIWMDMRMPIIDGFQATTQIKESPGGKDTVIIALTASAFEEDRQKVIEHGCNDFVRKPFKTHEIFKMIKKHLGVRYIYEEGEEGLKAAVPSEKMSDESLTTSISVLSEDIIIRLKEATELSDAAMIDEVIEEIRAENAQLSEALSELAASFAYDQILTLVQTAGEMIAEKQGQDSK